MRSLEQKLGTAQPPPTRFTTSQRGGQTTEATPPISPLDTPLPSPHKRNKLAPPPPHQETSKQENLLFILTSHCCSRDPNKALTEFLVWPLVNFYYLGKAKISGWYHNQHSTGDYNNLLPDPGYSQS